MSVSLVLPGAKATGTGGKKARAYKVINVHMSDADGVDVPETKKATRIHAPGVIGSLVKVTFGAGDFDVPTIAIALLIVGVVIALSGLILSIFATATASAISNPSPGSLAYNMTHPLVNGMISFFNFFPTLYVLLGVTGIVLIAAGIISIIMQKFKT
ncbi:hypothetical protein [Sulfolobus monocaudavirus SMV4]|uniref:hypothetical protein n=1 Tax=Sulfolobus monocaudavirus SMV4 TaxID=1732178 RepID=UPI000706D44E|nr:hypothetical protein AVT99_gp02 [Sulfolobus monocaudavirus SMV4]ALG97026.1 hypothetical protein [Sulfolobus monocaudavirus SMV4]